MTRKNTGPAFWQATEKIRRKKASLHAQRQREGIYRQGQAAGEHKAEVGVRTQVPAEFAGMIWQRFAEMVARKVFEETYDKAGPEIAAYSRMVAERVAKDFGHIPLQALEGYMAHDPASDNIRFTLNLHHIRVGYEVDRRDLQMMKRFSL